MAGSVLIDPDAMKVGLGFFVTGVKAKRLL